MISAGNDLGAASAAIDELRAELEAARARIAELERDPRIAKPISAEVLMLLSVASEMHKLVQGCSGCDYDEAEGCLFCHCKKCQLKITTRAYELFGVVK